MPPGSALPTHHITTAPADVPAQRRWNGKELAQSRQSGTPAFLGTTPIKVASHVTTTGGSWERLVRPSSVPSPVRSREERGRARGTGTTHTSTLPFPSATARSPIASLLDCIFLCESCESCESPNPLRHLTSNACFAPCASPRVMAAVVSFGFDELVTPGDDLHTVVHVFRFFLAAAVSMFPVAFVPDDDVRKLHTWIIPGPTARPTLAKE
mmetsp:Transcript_5010/g.18698  ORF Transcript_5010/g.18698 Transcript_5010/m.18698 type:complete len:211 (+) Transcript_5010:1372-2004(+)